MHAQNLRSAKTVSFQNCMEFVGRRLKVILIILPLVLVSLFAAFWLRSILEKPPTPKIIILNTLRWNMTKPQETSLIGERVETRYEDNNVNVWVSSAISIGTYRVDYYSAVGADMLGFGINCSANINSGYIQSMDINFSRTDNDSYVNPIEDWDHLAQAENLNVWRFDSKATSTNEAYVKARAVGQPNFAYLRIWNDWVLYATESGHSITVTLETTFFNGTDDVKTIMPILLEVHPS